MKVAVDHARCAGHGRCYELAPEVFGEDENGHAIVLSEAVAAGHEAQARRAERNCPERAIALRSS